jgi:putative glutamine amidotransferase
VEDTKSPPLVLIAPGTQPDGAEFADYAMSLSAAYPKAVVAGGALPWIMPCSACPEVIEACVARSDGVLLTGGDDIQPGLYRQGVPARLKKTVGPSDPARDLGEIALIREVFRQRKPLLAICRGQQILNVAFGGKLFVDLAGEVPGALDHCRMDRKNEVVHSIRVEKDSLLAQACGRLELGVNSTHHQAVRGPAPPFRVTGRSSDGVIEAMELDLAEGHLLPYLLAVQFHPERLIQQYPEFVEVFRQFARVCALRKKDAI